MQLTNKPEHQPKSNNKASLRSKLSLATCTLLQAASPAAQAQTGDWDIDTALLIYSEANRVSVFEPVISVKSEVNEDEYVKFKLVYDALTGSTPYGALPTDSVQTLTNPSGNSSYRAGPGELPLNDSFRDIRVAINGDWTIPMGRLKRITLGGNISSEYDFTSLGLSTSYMQDSADKNRTYSIGIGFNADTWAPVGGKNTEYAYMITPGSSTPQPKGGSDTKSNADLMLGLTQVINRSTIMQFNLGSSSSSGYLTDPYRFISIVGADGRPLLGLDAPTGAFPYLYEKRPKSRSRKTFFWRTVHHLAEDVINVSYRYFTDDWGINAHTLDFKYRYELAAGRYLQPHIRYYTQNAADFYVHSLSANETLPNYASADYRLGEFISTTLGLKYGMKLGHNNEFSLRAEFMKQSYNTVGELIGEQNNQNIVPDLNAVILQVGYNLYW